MDQIKVGAFLKDLRKEKGITQEQLAEKLGVSGRTISRWETGKNMPDISLLVISVCWLKLLNSLMSVYLKSSKEKGKVRI